MIENQYTARCWQRRRTSILSSICALTLFLTSFSGNGFQIAQLKSLEIIDMQNSEIIAKGKALSNEFDTRHAVIVDFTRSPDKHRFFIVDGKRNSVIYSWFTSHGAGSGSIDKTPKSFSNDPGSKMSVWGLLKTGGIYSGKNGRSLELIGLEPGVNDKAKSRRIVIHSAPYVSKTRMRQSKFPGRSNGCLTLAPEDARLVLELIKEGTPVWIEK